MNKKKQRGMTLIEVIAAMAIFVLVATALVGTIGTAFTINARNRTRAQSNANSRTFIEIIKSETYRPEQYTTTTGIKPGYYNFGFRDDSELENIVKNIESYRTANSSVDFNIVSQVATGDNKYVMAIKVNWLTTDKIYQFDIFSWDLSKGESSEISRRALVSPK